MLLPIDQGSLVSFLLLSADDPRSSLSTTEIFMIAVGTSILITTIIILGVLAVCKWRKKDSPGMNRSKANGHDRIINGGLRQPLFGGSKKYIRPEIVITEATSDDRRSSGHVSVLEVREYTENEGR